MTELDFEKAFKFPFNRAKGMLNIFWILVPIFGWLALGGYFIRIVQGFCRGKNKSLPEMKFMENMKFGFIMFLKSLPFIISLGLVLFILESISSTFGLISNIFLNIFIIPILTINFFVKESISSYFEFEIITKVFNNLGDYLIVVIKELLLMIVFLLMIIILVGIPALSFSKFIFISDFYRNNIK